MDWNTLEYNLSRDFFAFEAFNWYEPPSTQKITRGDMFCPYRIICPTGQAKEAKVSEKVTKLLTHLTTFIMELQDKRVRHLDNVYNFRLYDESNIANIQY